MGRQVPMTEYDSEGFNASLTTDAQNDELRRIDPITTDSPTVLPCGCSREMDCFHHHVADGETSSPDSVESGDRFELREGLTVEVAKVDGGTMVCETPFEGEEYVVPTTWLTHV